MKTKDKTIHALGSVPQFEKPSDDDSEKYVFHPQAIGALMVAVQYAMMTALLEKEDSKVIDLSEVLSNWTLSVDKKTGMLLVDNPPTFSWEEMNLDLSQESEDLP